MNIPFLRIALITGCFLLIPLIAMQFTSEVAWTISDFIFAAVLIGGVQFAYAVLSKQSNTVTYRVASALALLTAFALVWINGAVGIIGDGPINMLYLGVIMVLFFGAIVSRLKAQAMSNALFIAAAIQMIIPVIAFLVFKPDFSPGVVGVFGLNAVFASGFIGSGLLFRQSAQGH